MPKVNIGAKKVDQLQILLSGYVRAMGQTLTQVGNMIGTCDDTAGAKLRHPDDLTVGQMKRLGKSLGIPIDDLRSAIHY